MSFIFKYKQYVILLITVVVFSPTFFNDFQRGWDDQWQVLDYEFVTDHSFDQLIYHFTNYHLGQYFPVNTLLYIAIYELFGFSPVAYHAACLMIHIINVLLVYSIIQTTIKWVKPLWNMSRISTFAAIPSLIFAIHPLQVESVAWISASKIVLYTVFFLLGILMYLRYLKTLRIWWLAGVAICYLLAYGSKEQAIIFPLNLLAFDYIFNRFKDCRFSLSSIKSRVIVEKIPFFLLALFMYGFSVSNNLGTFNTDTYPLYQRLMFGMSSFMEYLFRFIAPVKLFYFYFFPIKVGEELPLYYWGYPLLILICLAVIRYNHIRNNRLAIFGLLLFVINIILALHIIPMPRQMITADRYMYFSIIGVSLSATWLGYYFYLKREKWRKFMIPGLIAWLLFLCVHSFIRTMEWKDSDSIKKNVNELIERRKANNQPVINNPLKNESYGKE